MKEFVAKNDRQLGLCLKLLYSKRIPYQVDLELTAKDKVLYIVSVNVDDDTANDLEFTYKIMIG